MGAGPEHSPVLSGPITRWARIRWARKYHAGLMTIPLGDEDARIIATTFVPSKSILTE